ncbi:hypothetical protein RGL65_004423 [Vibrio parahaemolyticus]|nr:hypothetical protein [Vibrio parahaemolyticus]
MLHKNKKASLRIHHVNRMKDKAFKKLYGTWYLPSCTEGKDEAIKAAKLSASRVKDHLAVCSCFGCGNPRRHSFRKNDKLTMQERRFLDGAKSWDY